MEGNRPNFEQHNDTMVLTNFLKLKLVDEEVGLVTYAELSACVGRPIRTCLHLLRTARKNLEAEHRVLTDVVRSEGIVLTQAYTACLDSTNKSIGKKCRKASKRVVNAVADKDLTSDESRKLGAQLSMLGTMAVMSKPSSVKRLESKTTKAAALPVAETIKLFSE